MRHIILYDPEDARGNLLPMTYLRPICELRIGIDTLREKWQAVLPGAYSYLTVDYLSTKYNIDPDAESCLDTLYIAGDVVATSQLANQIENLEPGHALDDNQGHEIARRGAPHATTRHQTTLKIMRIRMLYDIFQQNYALITSDFDRYSSKTPSRPIDPTVTIVGDPSRLYIHPDAGNVRGCVINVDEGPVYIGPEAEVMEGVCMRGPIAVCKASVINMGAKIYGGTTIGPHSKVGGELNNVVIQAYSNKAHDGFLGNAVIGEWCNLGAGCSASNLKNDYTEIKLWNYPAHRFLRTGLQFCGLIMGDHSKIGVNAMLNTASVLGVGVNIHGSGFPRPFLASFSEGSVAGFTDVPMTKFFETTRKMMARRSQTLTDEDITILTRVREIAEQYR